MKLLLACLACLAIAAPGCVEEGDDGRAVHIEVGDDFFQVRDDAGSRNDAATIGAHDHLEFLMVGERGHQISIHRPPAAADDLLLEVAAPAGSAPIEFDATQTGTYHVWCNIHGSMTGGMHITLQAE